MMAGKFTRRYAMSDADRQRQEAARVHLLLKVIWRGKLPQCLLNGDLPCARSGHDHKVAWICDCIPRLGNQAFIS